MHNNKNSTKFIKKPDFNIIGNLYDDLERLRNKYGIEQLILHLGEVARLTVSRDVASKIWSVLNLEKRIETRQLKDGE